MNMVKLKTFSRVAMLLEMLFRPSYGSLELEKKIDVRKFCQGGVKNQWEMKKMLKMRKVKNSLGGC